MATAVYGRGAPRASLRRQLRRPRCWRSWPPGGRTAGALPWRSRTGTPPAHRASVRRERYPDTVSAVPSKRCVEQTSCNFASPLRARSGRLCPRSLCLSDVGPNRLRRASENEFGELNGVHDGEGPAPRDILGESHFVAAEHDCREPLRNVENLRISPCCKLQNLPRHEGSTKDQIGVNSM